MFVHSSQVSIFNLCKENPTLVNGLEVRGKAKLTDGDQFVIGYRVFVFRDASYASKRTDPRPFGSAASADETETADVHPTRKILDRSSSGSSSSISVFSRLPPSFLCAVKKDLQ